MDGRDCEMAKDSPSSSSSLYSGSKIKENSTGRIETEEGPNTPGSKPKDTEAHGSSSSRDHSFDHVLDELPWSNTMPPSKLCAVCQNMVDELGRGDWLKRSKENNYLFYDTGIPHVRNPLSIKTLAQNGCSFCATFNRTDKEEEFEAEISAYIDKWRVEFGEAPLAPSRVYMGIPAGRNRGSFLSELKMKELPKTFCDAIELCMELNIVYIWIDSLCIIQDDEEDWMRESVTMADIYGRCFLNIAASSAIDGSQGCFFSRRDSPRCRISLRFGGDIHALYHCTPITKHPLDSHRVCPLESRGWTLQERLLSPRTVHFTREEVFWECHTKFVSESSPFCSIETESLRKYKLSIRSWNKIVRNYSGRHLTYAKDRLIALAGLAEEIKQETKSEYFAGMWYNNLLAQLCWSVVGHDVYQRISPQRAPTWSWASVPSQVRTLPWRDTDKFALCKVLRVEKSASKHQSGDMPDGSLWLSCPPLLLAQIIQPRTMSMGGLSITHVWFKIDCVEDTVRVNIYILRLLKNYCLILRSVEKSQGVYIRIGFLVFYECSLLSYDNPINYAEDSAYIPREKHRLDTDEHVISLV
ncbi:putative chlorogenic acid esterase precursor protein [Botrytis fragariae]|uniref:Putative chlorogenic acid esterase protein n=1 Tax=Botrytis fragariae TaxID=1964551 RepID=A0A8H6AXM3_9HELO|nr:putative chlorogenic acid esterase precursor protein [Botrytis fragariae]KAF5875518.1 putative chlorogenic acid esterase precursor protein [Botrytis fragariae]